MLRCVFCIVVAVAGAFQLTSPSPAQSLMETGRAVVPYSFSTWRPASQEPPLWTGGVMVVVDKNGSDAPVIRSFDATGFELRAIYLSIPQATMVRVRSVARGADGSYGVCGQAFDYDGRGSGFVTWVSSGLEAFYTARTYPYLPNIIAMAPDETLWTEGLEADEYGNDRNQKVADWSRGIIRHFDTSGRQIGSFMPRSHLSGNRKGLIYGFVAAGGDRVGWYANLAHAYFELNPSSGKVESFPGAAAPNDESVRVSGMAMLRSGDVLVGVGKSGEATRLVYRLDRTSRSWKLLAMPFKEHGAYSGLLVGGDGSRLAVFGTAPSGIVPSPLRFLELKN
jgi:hypothetical protein